MYLNTLKKKCCVPVNLVLYVSNMLVCNVIRICSGLKLTGVTILCWSIGNFVIKFSFLLVEHSVIFYHDQ